MSVGFARSTYALAKEFQAGVEELAKQGLALDARTYLITGARNEELGDDFYKRVDELQDIRKRGIGAEMHYAVAQANGYLRRNPDNPAKSAEELLGADVISGDSMVIGFSRDMYEIAPSLRVYELFMWIGLAELENLGK